MTGIDFVLLDVQLLLLASASGHIVEAIKTGSSNFEARNLHLVASKQLNLDPAK